MEIISTNKERSIIKVKCKSCGEIFKIGISKYDMINGVFAVEIYCTECLIVIKKSITQKEINQIPINNE